MLGWILAIVIGAIAGWLASIIMKTNAQQGLLMDIIIGVVGGVIGNFLANLLNLGGGGLVWQLILSVGGAVILLAIIKAVRGRM